MAASLHPSSVLASRPFVARHCVADLTWAAIGEFSLTAPTPRSTSRLVLLVEDGFDFEFDGDDVADHGSAGFEDPADVAVVVVAVDLEGGGVAGAWDAVGPGV